MRNKKLLILVVLGLFTVTVFLAWFSANRKNSELAFAQSGPFPTGCVSAQNELIWCDCTGFTNTGTQTGSTGTTGFIVQDSTCANPNDPPGSCTQISNPVAVDNPPCCDQDRDGYNRTSCGGSDCNDDPFDGGYYIKPSAPEICDGKDNNCTVKLTKIVRHQRQRQSQHGRQSDATAQ